jgi:type I restriction enzyme S subunit
MSLPAYKQYKKAGSDWLAEVPSHWDVLPCRAIVHERTDKNEEGANQDYLSLMANVGVIPYEEKGDVGNKKPEDLSKCKLVSKGDLVINSMNYGIGSYGLSNYSGVCSPVYIVLRPRLDKIHARFAFRIFQNRAFQTYAQSFGNGILEHRAAINWDILKNIPIGVPPLEEQEAVLQFLDHETSKIDALIAEQIKLLELLAEKRQATISHAVTRGLNPEVSMKDTGMAWLRNVPAHWTILPFRRAISKIEQGWSPNAGAEPRRDDEWGVLKISAVKSGRFLEQENKALLDDTTPDVSIQISPGDLLLTRANTPDLVGDCCVVPEGAGSKLMMSDLIYRIKVNADCDPRFLCHFLVSDIGRAQIKSDARGSSMTMAKISQGHISAWTVCVPPLAEQAAIVAFLTAEAIKLDALKAEAERAIDLLKEHRSALISAAVTGKIDVREHRSVLAVAA